MNELILNVTFGLSSVLIVLYMADSLFHFGIFDKLSKL